MTRPGRIRTLGPLAALLVPLTLSGIGLLVLAAWPCSGRGCIEPSLGAWVLVLFAFPTALIAGLPWYVNPLTVGVAFVSSVGLWMVLGAIAGRRATRELDAGWGTFAVEMLGLALGVIGGVLVGFAVIVFWTRL